MGSRRTRDMTHRLPMTEIEREEECIRTLQQWKRDARKLIRVTPDALVEFDQTLDRYIGRSRARIARLTAEADR